MVLFYVFPTRNIVNFLVNFTFLLQHTFQWYLRYSLFVMKVTLKPNQSLDQSVPLSYFAAPCLWTRNSQLKRRISVFGLIFSNLFAGAAWSVARQNDHVQ